VNTKVFQGFPDPDAHGARESLLSASTQSRNRLWPSDEETRLEPNYDGLTSVVSVVSTVVAGERRRGCGYRQECDKQVHHDLLHFCSSNSSQMGFMRGLQFGIPHPTM
jgi:hypothetical protein